LPAEKQDRLPILTDGNPQQSDRKFNLLLLKVETVGFIF